VRGAKGGYLLALSAEQITLFDIVRTLEGPLAVVECVQDPLACDRVGGCTVHLVWGEMSQLLVDYLSGISLARLAAEQVEKNTKCSPVQAAAAS
jgi:Rrf2 family protein